MNALALVAIKLSTMVETLGEGEAPARAKPVQGARWLKSLAGGAILVHELDDAVLVDLGQSIRDVEANELGAALRAHLGFVLDAHDDDRGVFLFPEKVRPDASTAAAVIEEVADFGEWAPLTTVEIGGGMPGIPDGLEAMMGEMLGGAGIDPSDMQGLFAQAQQMMADPAAAEQMMQAAAKMMGGMPDLGAEGGALDMSALAAQAQQLAEDDPELVARLGKHLGGAKEDGKDGDDT